MPVPLICKLEAFGPLPDGDKQALGQAVARTRWVSAGYDLVHKGDRPTDCHLILQGFACRHRRMGDGQRQILSFEIPGDLHGFLLGKLDHAVATLTPCRVATLPREVLTDWVERRPAVARALWRGTLVDAAISGTWIVNVGRRTAREQIAHLLCEVLLRLEAVGLAEDDGCTLPITQTEIANALGLSVVHVNRTLQRLDGKGLVKSGSGQVTIDDLRGLQAAGEFDHAYLHQHGDVSRRTRGGRAGNGGTAQTRVGRGGP